MMLRRVTIVISLAIACATVLAHQPARAQEAYNQDVRSATFEVVVLDSTVTNPMEIAIARDGRVFIAERGGALKVWDPAADSTYTVGFFPSSATLNDGFLGLTLDPSFDENGWAYLHYSPVEGEPRNRVSRVTIDGRRVRPGSEKILLEWNTQRRDCCHAGGSIAFGPAGNLFIATGDNTFPEEDLYAPIDERPGHEISDAQRTAGNTNDLRGSILRIRPTPDGSYTIPEGNLFPPGTPKTRPEIYVMGVRNAYRIAIDPKTGWLFWGDVGPGAVVPDDQRGPAGYDEINVARAPGFFGWPYFNADNRPYRELDFETGAVGAYYDQNAPINNSPNNTGLRELPPAQPPAIWYTKTDITDFPVLGTGGATAIAGPRYRYDQETVHPNGLPAQLDGKLIIGDWMRNWFMLVDLDAEGRAVHIEPFLEDLNLRPMDIEVGHDGRLYVVDWGPRYIGYNLEARIVRLDYRGDRSDAHRATRADRAPAQGHPTEITQTQPRAIAQGNQRAGPRVIQPANGAIFDYDEPIRYEIDSPAGAQVITSWLCDSHVHPLDTLTGSSGTIRVSRRPVEIGYTIKREEALIVDVRGEGETRRLILQPRRKEAEHVLDARNVEREHLTNIRDSAYVQTAIAARDGGYAAYGPVNLTGIGTINLRVKPVSGSIIEFRLDGAGGELVGSVRADSAAARRYPARTYPRVPDGFMPPPLDGWADLPVPLNLPEGGGGAHALYLVFRKITDDVGRAPLVLVDWLDFERAAPAVLQRAHAHNDYEHGRPLLDALDRGFMSVEVDVHLVGDSLFVSHDPEDIRPGRTLASLYLEPLRRWIRQHGGVVYPDGPPLQLLVDVKTEADSTYRVLRRILGEYSDLLTRFEGESVEEGAVTVVISGNRAWEAMRTEKVRLAAYDGRLSDLDHRADASPALIPLISIDWSGLSSWRGDGEIPIPELERLREIVDETHRQGRALRFWGTLDTTSVWRVLEEEGVDFIGTDDLGGLQRFLLRSD